MSKFGVILLYFCLCLPLFTCSQFGFNNFYTCHCESDNNCNRNTGQCSGGNCQRGWSGSSCQRENVALDKTASQVSINNGRGAGLAIDGERDNSLRKCIDTGYNNNPWWRVDLQQTYPIRDINIVYQDTYLFRFVGFIIQVETETGQNTTCYQHTGDVNTLSDDFTVTCNSNINGRYVRIYIPRNGNEFLVLCEVEVYVCSVGTYGNDCNSFCHCLGNARCDYLTGTCPGAAGSKCQTGWTGTSCNQDINECTAGTHTCDNNAYCINTLGSFTCTCNNGFTGNGFSCTECSPGMHGFNCQQSCSSNCLDSQDCHHVTGKCNGGCKSGYQGDTCTQECSPGSYALNCLQSCSVNCLDSQDCHHVTGKCNGGCKPGYQGDTCTQECSPGSYGSSCLQSCSSNCQNSQDCNNVNGNCNGECKPGYQGDTCTQKCSPGSYGLNCQYSCSSNCLTSQDCNHVNGKCNGRCKPGYQGDNCAQDCSQGYYGQDCIFQCKDRYCKGSEECDHVTGSCIDGCDAGFAGENCLKSKKFGFNKFYTCHCKDEELCNNLNGQCPGACDNSWSGQSCQRQNVAFNKTSSQIHTINNGQASFAVDGNRDNVVNNGPINDANPQKCTDTNNQNNPWWRVDLQQSYPIRDINIVYRNTFLFRLIGFRIDIETETGQNTTCYQHNGDVNSLSYDFTVTCNNTINGRYVTITVPRNGFIVLCEVEVYVCAVGTYGVDCNTFCHCANNVRCDYLTGKCPGNSCQAGWTGNDCNQVCKGSYGQDCSQNCSNRHCDGNQNCNHVTGICIDGCIPGYQSDDCTHKCEDKYGEKCGYDCKSRNCSGNQECHHVTGRCPEGCTAGYNGDDCTKECDNGYYGNNCSLVCSQRFCLNDQASCSNVDGSCGGDCQTDYEGGDCTVKKGATTEDNTVIIASTVSVVVILIIIIIILIIIIHVIRRRRPLQREMPSVNPTVQFVQGKPPMYENAAFIQQLTEASNSRITESSESDYAQLDLGDNLQTLYCNLPLTKSETELKELNDFIVKTKVENEIDGFASFKEIPGCNQPKSYIAAQESTDVTTTDFIKLIWKRKFDKVVMVTRKHEIAEIKYWPEMGTETFGDFKLTLIQEKTRADFTVRVVSIQKDNSKHQFHQFHYTSWPGHGVPDTHDLLDFIFTVNKVNPKSTTPQLIHCITGVEITGTYIAIDICLKTWKSKGEAGVISCLKKMKDKRRGMIQTASQLKFVYDVLLEGITRGDTSLNKDIFEANYDKQGYNFEMGNMTSPGHFQFLKSIQTGTDNISKVYNSYTNHNGYYFESLTKLDTMWKTIHDRQSSIVVFIIDDDTNQTDLHPGIGSTEWYNDIKVKTISQENLSDKITRMSVSATQKESQTDLLVFTLKIQKSEAKTFTYLTQTAVELLQHLTVDEHNDKPITMFTCNLQFVRVFCILRNIVQRLLLEGEVEIVQNVRKMHQQIEKTIFTEEEFMVLYQVISEYIKSTNVYDYVK